MMTRLQFLPSLAFHSHLYELLVVLVLCLCSARTFEAHNDDAPPASCNSDQRVTVEAAFRPGIITVDADTKDWADVEGHQFPLMQAINPDPSEKYPMDPGSIQIKAVHDGRDIFFNLEVPGDYVFKAGAPKSWPAVALMFAIGDDATYYNMGGCSQRSDNCSTASCHGYDVDIMQFFISTAIPGRLYGSNLLDNLSGTGADRFGNLNDMYAWNPHCVFKDGTGPDAVKGSGAQNDWQGAWSHTSISLDYGLVQGDSPFSTHGTKGFYVFEFSRPFRTNDRLQQDVQFTIGGTFSFGVALWYPVDGRPWIDQQHYSANCAWIPLKISGATGSNLTSSKAADTLSKPGDTSSKAVDILSIFSIFVALLALATSLVLGWWVKSRNPQPGFQTIPNL